MINSFCNFVNFILISGTNSYFIYSIRFCNKFIFWSAQFSRFQVYYIRTFINTKLARYFAPLFHSHDVNFSILLFVSFKPPFLSYIVKFFSQIYWFLKKSKFLFLRLLDKFHKQISLQTNKPNIYKKMWRELIYLCL